MITEFTKVYTNDLVYIDIFVSNLLVKQRVIEFGKSVLLMLPWFIYTSYVNVIIDMGFLNADENLFG